MPVATVEACRVLWDEQYRQLHLRTMRETAERWVELDPNDAEGRRQFGWLLWFTGHADEALPHLKMALELDPRSDRARWGYFFMGNASLALERYDVAEEMYGNAVRLKTDMSSGHIGLICTYLSQGKLEPAVEQNRRFRSNPDKDRYFVKAADVELLLGNIEDARSFAERGANDAPEARYYPRGVYATTILGCVLWDADRAEADRRLNQSVGLAQRRLEMGDESFMPRYDLAAVHAIRGDTVEACRWLRRAAEAGWRTYRLAARDPLLRNLRGTEEFQEILTFVEEKVQRGDAWQRVDDQLSTPHGQRCGELTGA